MIPPSVPNLFHNEGILPSNRTRSHRPVAGCGFFVKKGTADRLSLVFYFTTGASGQ